MTIDRREFLKRTGLSLAGMAALPKSSTKIRETSSEDAYGILYDATKCIGCRECETACRARRDLPQGDDTELDADTWTIIKLYQDEGDSVYSFVKRNCMHCIDPACVSACPVGAMQKTDEGPVVYDDSICIGCRYCMAACPFEVPKYEWEKVFPRVQKCDMCVDRIQEGQAPACVEACRIGALTFGKRAALIEEAHARIANEPEKYVDYVYGEHEVGGTSVLYLARVPHENLGLPTLTSTSLPSLTWPWMKAVPGVAVVVGSLMTFLYWFTGRKIKMQTEEVEK